MINTACYFCLVFIHFIKQTAFYSSSPICFIFDSVL
nr:MAG TPA: hypothetical protein [Caudoviricetes sp.]